MKNSLLFGEKSNHIKLICFGVISQILYLTAYVKNIFPGLINNNSMITNAWSVMVLIFLTLCFIKSFSYIDDKKSTFKIIVFFTLLFQFSLLFSRPVASEDLYSYIARARVISVHHKNPFTNPYANFVDDALYQELYTAHAKNTAIYGPLFMSLSGLVSKLAGDRFYMNLILFKSIFVLANTIIIYLVHKLTHNTKATFLYAWNPLVVFEFALNGHNDVLTLLLVAFSLVLLFKKSKGLYIYLSFILFFFSVLIKFFSVLLLPFFILYVLRGDKGIKQKAVRLSVFGLLAVFTTVLFYLPYWDNLIIFNQVINVSFYQTLLPSAGIVAVSSLLASFGVKEHLNISRTVNRSFFAIAYIILILKAIYASVLDKKRLIFYMMLTNLVFFATFFSWFLPWYLTNIIFLVVIYYAITKKGLYVKAVYALTFYGFFHYLALKFNF